MKKSGQARFRQVTVSPVLTALLLAALGLAGTPAFAEKKAPAAPAFAAVIEREVPAIMQEAHIKGVAIGLIVHGELAYARGFGFADHAGTKAVTPDTVFVAASLSKPIAAWVAERLVRDGKIALDQSVADIVTPWPLAASNFDQRAITFRHLLSHTAGTTLGGYQGWLDYAELPTLEESLAGKTNGRGPVELFAAAGTKFQYSGGSYTLMQLAIERRTGRKYVDLAQELLFQPLGMQHTSVAMTPALLADAAQGHGDDGSPVPARYYAEQAPSTLTTTLNDFALWMRASMTAAKGERGSLLSRAAIDEMYTPARLSEPRAPQEAIYGLGHFIEPQPDGATAVGHDGRNQAGFRAKFLMRPQSGNGIVFFSNSRSGLALDRVVCLWAADEAKVDGQTSCGK